VWRGPRLAERFCQRVPSGTEVHIARREALALDILVIATVWRRHDLIDTTGPRRQCMILTFDVCAGIDTLLFICLLTAPIRINVRHKVSKGSRP